MLDIKAQEGEGSLLHVVYLDTVCLSGFDGHLALSTLNALAHPPDVDDGIAVHDEPKLVVAIDVEDDGLILRRDEGTFETG